MIGGAVQLVALLLNYHFRNVRRRTAIEWFITSARTHGTHLFSMSRQQLPDIADCMINCTEVPIQNAKGDIFYSTESEDEDDSAGIAVSTADVDADADADADADVVVNDVENTNNDAATDDVVDTTEDKNVDIADDEDEDEDNDEYDSGDDRSEAELLDKGVELGSNDQDIIDDVYAPELVRWTSCPIRNGAMDGRPSTLPAHWKTDDVCFDPLIYDAMSYSHWRSIKRFFKLNNNLTNTKKKGDDGYDPCRKYNFIYKVLVHNMNYVTNSADLDATVDESTWGFGGYSGDCGQRLMNKPVLRGKFVCQLYIRTLIVTNINTLLFIGCIQAAR